MAEIKDILTRSKQVRDETQVGRNTAIKVGGILVDLCQLVKTGGVEVPSRDVRFRGEWSESVANSSDPYVCDETTIDSVYYQGCKWVCKKDLTKLAPVYPFSDWSFLEGNPYFLVEMLSSSFWNFRISQILRVDSDGNYIPFTTLYIKGWLYNQDVTPYVKSIKWTRDTGRPNEDLAWNKAHESAGDSIKLTYEDIGGVNYKMGTTTFKCEAQIDAGKSLFTEFDMKTI